MSVLGREVTISTPGKVLASGGYMVLQDGHAVVLSTNSRFYSKVKATFTASSDQKCTFNVHVVSPQFQKSWSYLTSWDLSERQASDFKFESVSEKSDGSNVFVQFAVFYALAAAACLPQKSKITAGSYDLKITIQADNDFYSQSKSVRQPFNPTFDDLAPVSGLELGLSLGPPLTTLFCVSYYSSRTKASLLHKRT